MATLRQLKDEWLSKHPNATLEQAFDAGAFSEAKLWCNRPRK